MGGKLDWDETISRLYEEIPEAKTVNWEGLFRSDPKILGDMINDVIKVSVSKKGRPGKRSANSEEDVAADLRKLTNSDYADDPFVVAIRYAMGDRSLRQTAAMSGIDKMRLHRLVNGLGIPATGEEMEKLGLALKKDPSYFLEYRAAFVCHALYRMLMDNPDSAVVFYKKIRNA